jgi:hypothetical protein
MRVENVSCCFPTEVYIEQSEKKRKEKRFIIFHPISVSLISSRQFTAFAYILSVRIEGESAPVLKLRSRRTIAGGLVPMSLATSDWLSPACLRAQSMRFSSLNSSSISRNETMLMKHPLNRLIGFRGFLNILFWAILQSFPRNGNGENKTQGIAELFRSKGKFGISA